MQNSTDMFKLLASSNNHLEVIQIQETKGISFLIHDTDNNGCTLLHHAAHAGNQSLVTYLLSNGADYKTKDFKGDTPLRYAARADHVQMVKLLLEKTSNGAPAIHWAASHLETRPVLVWLLEKGESVDQKNKAHETTLDYVLKAQQTGNVELLIKRGGTISVMKDNYGVFFSERVKLKQAFILLLLFEHSPRFFLCADFTAPRTIRSQDLKILKEHGVDLTLVKARREMSLAYCEFNDRNTSKALIHINNAYLTKPELVFNDIKKMMVGFSVFSIERSIEFVQMLLKNVIDNPEARKFSVALGDHLQSGLLENLSLVEFYSSELNEREWLVLKLSVIFIIGDGKLIDTDKKIFNALYLLTSKYQSKYLVLNDKDEMKTLVFGHPDFLSEALTELQSCFQKYSDLQQVVPWLTLETDVLKRLMILRKSPAAAQSPFFEHKKLPLKEMVSSKILNEEDKPQRGPN